MQKAICGVALAGINCSIIGTYVVLRRMSFIGGALSHTILPGIVFAYIKGFAMVWGALGASVITAFGVGWLSSRKEIREDTAIGVVLSAMFALGVLMMSFIRSFRDFGSILFGSVLGITSQDLLFMSGVTIVVLSVVFALYKELKLSSYDPDYSKTIGINPGKIRYVLLFLIALSVVSAVQIVGALLTTALLITPAASACLIGRSVKSIMLASACIAVFSGIAGLVISYHFRISSGAAIVIVCSLIFLITWFYRTISDKLWQNKSVC